VKKGCVVTLGFWAAFVALYAWIAWPVVREPMPTAMIAILGGTFAAMLVGAIVGLFTGGSDRAAFARARAAEARKDGRLEVASGPIRPLGEPLTAPFSSRACVAYEYDVKPVPRGQGRGAADFAGVALCPSAIDTPRGPVRILGWAMLDKFPNAPQKAIDSVRAEGYIRQQQFEELGITKVLSIFSELMADDDGAIRKDFRIGEAEPGVEGKTLSEKIVAPGATVTAIGIFSEAAQGFTPAKGTSINRLFPGDLETVARATGKESRRSFFAAVFFFCALHAILVPMYLLGRAHQARTTPAAAVPREERPAQRPRGVPEVPDERVTVENGHPLADDSGALATVKEYLAAVNEGDTEAMARLVPGSSKKLLDERKDEDLAFWQSMRPREVREAGGYENDEAATIRVEGPSPKDPHRVVMYNLKKTFEGWRIYREWFPQDPPESSERP
jgi:hypothetical protein